MRPDEARDEGSGVIGATRGGIKGPILAAVPMASVVARRPARAVSAMLVGLLAIAGALVILALPTGRGEAGYASLMGHVVWALLAADASTVLWAILAASSRRRRERGAWYLLAGLVALAVPPVFCLVSYVSPLALAILVAPAWVIGGIIILVGRAPPASA